MIKLALFTVLFLVLHYEADAKNWALLVAGSNGWYNYRHQADVCHAYQILHKHGIPEENIVVMMYDDLADNSENPTKGIIINKPNGSDVYHGVPKDYTKDDVTPENFLKILKGDKEGMRGIGSGKVIESGPDDYVFVNFADHGAPGLVAFPLGVLKVGQLQNAINYMHKNKKYKKMVFYVEACESGSMFDQTLAHNIKVFATTAANARESSYACYWDSERQTYLGDVYSIKWMEDSDKEDLTTETLQQQFEIVKKETTTSHVMEYGDMTLKNDPVGLYQGDKKANVTSFKQSKPITDAVPSPDVPLMILYKKLELAKTKAEYMTIKRKIIEEEDVRSLIRVTVKHIAAKLVAEEPKRLEVLSSPAEIRNRGCYEKAVDHFNKHCFNLNKYEYALRHIFVLSNLCDHGIPVDVLTKTAEHVCKALKVA